jgi:uncharacterized protein YdeI (YjbR/CyaY-like superfamily)
MNPQFFRNKKELRAWFKKLHKTEKEIWIGFYKKSLSIEGVTYNDAVDVALCFGWIDGIRKSFDEKSYMNRFTPRNPKSNWSLININKVEELKKLGLMEPAGLEAFEKRRADRSGVYSFEQQKNKLDEQFIKIFKKNKKAWKYFEEETPSYKKISSHWVMSAKKEETKLKRLEVLISSSESRERIPLLRRSSH